MQHNPAVLVHIGYPKTASTTLQTLFEENEQFAYLGNGLLQREAADGLSARVLKLLLCADDCEFDAAVEKMRTEVETWSCGRPVILSDEGLAFGKFMERQRIWGDVALKINNSPARLAPRIWKLFPNASMLIFTREQSAFAISYYKQHAKIGAVGKTLAEWFSGLDDEFFRLLDFAEVIGTYVEVFGLERVAVFPFEGIHCDEQRVQLKHFIEQQLGVNSEFIMRGYDSRHENTDLGRMPKWLVLMSGSRLVTWCLKWIPDALKVALKRKLFKPHSLELSDTVKTEIIRRFSASNARLKALYGINYGLKEPTV